MTTERGEFATGEHGFAIWFPTVGSGGMTAENLRTLATELDRLNAPWHEENKAIGDAGEG